MGQGRLQDDAAVRNTQAGCIVRQHVISQLLSQEAWHHATYVALQIEDPVLRKRLPKTRNKYAYTYIHLHMVAHEYGRRHTHIRIHAHTHMHTHLYTFPPRSVPTHRLHGWYTPRHNTLSTVLCGLFWIHGRGRTDGTRLIERNWLLSTYRRLGFMRRQLSK